MFLYFLKRKFGVHSTCLMSTNKLIPYNRAIEQRDFKLGIIAFPEIVYWWVH